MHNKSALSQKLKLSVSLLRRKRRRKASFASRRSDDAMELSKKPVGFAVKPPGELMALKSEFEHLPCQ
jgi:hypothetical protein